MKEQLDTRRKLSYLKSSSLSFSELDRSLSLNGKSV